MREICLNLLKSLPNKFLQAISRSINDEINLINLANLINWQIHFADSQRVLFIRRCVFQIAFFIIFSKGCYMFFSSTTNNNICINFCYERHETESSVYHFFNNKT